RRASYQPLGAHFVNGAARYDERPVAAGIVLQQILEARITQNLHCAHEGGAEQRRQLRCPVTQVTIRNERSEELIRLTTHRLGDALQALDEPSDVVVAVLVLPDLLNDLRRRLVVALGGRRGGDRGALVIGPQRSVRAR